MSSETSHRRVSQSVIDGLNVRDERALDRACQQLADSLCRWAQKQIGNHLARRYSGEDARDSAYVIFIKGVKKGRYQFDHGGALWNLLKTITLNKIRKQGRNANHENGKVDFEQLADSSMSGQETGKVVQGFQDFLCELGPREGDAPTVAACRQRAADIFRLLYLEEKSVAETAEEVGYSRWTVRRVRNEHKQRMFKKLGIAPTSDHRPDSDSDSHQRRPK